jgi:hypothetical protein
VSLFLVFGLGVENRLDLLISDVRHPVNDPG